MCVTFVTTKSWEEQTAYSGCPLDVGYLDFIVRSLKEAAEKQKAIHIIHELKSCSLERDLLWGRRIHAKVVSTGNDSNFYVMTAVLKMYGRCGSMVDARRVFDSIQKPDVVSYTALLLGYVENGEGDVALDIFSMMNAHRECPPNSVTFLAAIKACTSLAVNGDKSNSLTRGREIHSKIEHHLDHYVQNTLIDMYAKCGSMGDACRVFYSIQNPDVVSWTSLLLGYVENGEGDVALNIFSMMKVRGCAPNSVTYVAALKACSSLAVRGDRNEKAECLKLGRKLHSEIGDHLDRHMQSTLIQVYGNCGSLAESQRVFDSIRKPDVVSWTALLLGYVENGEGGAALDLFSKMKASGCPPNSVTYVSALKAACSLVINGKDECLKLGREIHSEIGHHLNRHVQSALIDMYCKCGSMVDARLVFDSIENPGVMPWTSLLLGYAENGEGNIALDMFFKLKNSHACPPNSVTYISAFKACSSLAVNGDGKEKGDSLRRGREIHSEIGHNLDHYALNTLIGMYGKCGSMVEARRIFNSIQKPDVVSWTSMILGYAENGEGVFALDMFASMKAGRGCLPDSRTYVAAIKACTSMAVNGDDMGKDHCLKLGREIHSEIGDHLDHYVQSTLIEMYGKCGNMVDARRVFDNILKPDVVCWNALILGYAENEEADVALDIFYMMKAVSACSPTSVTYVAALKACGMIGALACGWKIHLEMREFSTHVVTCLVDFYAKCGNITKAHEVFDTHLNARNVVTWNALLAGYSSFGDIFSVFNLLKAMQVQMFQPDAITFLCILSCCSHAGLVKKAREYFEAMPVQYGVTRTQMHYNCMLDVLGRANHLNEAIALLRNMPYNPNAVTWMTLLCACCKWKNVEIGRYAFHSLVDLDKKTVSAYVMMAQIYGSRDMWQEQERVMEIRTKFVTWRLPAQTYVLDELGKRFKFVEGEESKDPPEVESELQHLTQGMKRQSFVAESYKINHNIADICGHSERRAVVYGILKTPLSEPVRAFKTAKMCDDCHVSIKMFSKLCERTVMVRDASRWHVMVNGSCSCGDFW